MSSFKRFDKSKLSCEDKATINDCICTIDCQRIVNGIKKTHEHIKLENNLFGLFDGYQYNDTTQLINHIGCDGSVKRAINQIILKIK